MTVENTERSNSVKLSVIEIKSLRNELVHCHRDLQILREQKAKYGIDVPLHIVNAMLDLEERVEEINKSLSGEIDTRSLAMQYFSEGTKALIDGDYWESLRFYKMAKEEDPFYPRVDQQIAQVKRLVRRHELPRIDEVDREITAIRRKRISRPLTSGWLLPIIVISAIIGASVGIVWGGLFGVTNLLMFLVFGILGSLFGLAIAIFLYIIIGIFWLK